MAKDIWGMKAEMIASPSINQKVGLLWAVEELKRINIKENLRNQKNIPEVSQALQQLWATSSEPCA